MMAFVDFARVHGLEIARLEQSEEIHRCPTTTHPASKNGAYLFNGRRGIVWNWESGEPAQWWNDDKVTPWSDAEKREWARRQDSARQAKLKNYEEAAKRAAALIKQARLDTHPYLTEKGFPEEKGLISQTHELLIPMRDAVNSVRGVQRIALSADRLRWDKKMLFGMQAKGSRFRFGGQHALESFLVEGYATGLSVWQAIRSLRINAHVLVCFSAQNLTYVTQNIAGRRFIFADNDHSQSGQTAAIAAGVPYVMSDVVGEDANDLHKRLGVMAVARKVMEARKMG